MSQGLRRDCCWHVSAPYSMRAAWARTSTTEYRVSAVRAVGMRPHHAARGLHVRTRVLTRKPDRLRRRGGTAAHAAPRCVRSTSWTQHTAARMRVGAHGDRQRVPDCAVTEEQQHTHAVPRYVHRTSRRQHTAARMRVCVHGDEQEVPGCVAVEEEQHKLLPGESQYKLHPCIYTARQGDSTQLLVCVYAHTATGSTHPAVSSWRSSSARRTQIHTRQIYTRLPAHHGDSTQRLACAYAHTATGKRYPMVSSWRSSSTCRSCVCTHHVKEIAHSCSYAWIRVRRQTRRTRSCRRGRGSSTSCPQGSRSTSCTPCIYAAHQGDSAQLLVCVYAHTATSILYPTASFVEEQQHMPLPDIYAARPGDSTQLLARAYACAATRKPGQLRRRGGAL